MATTYEKIATTTLSATAGFIDFTSISSAYTDLRLVLVARSDRAATTDSQQIYFNGAVGNCSWTRLTGNGTAASSSRGTSTNTIVVTDALPAASATSGIFGFITFDIFSYASTSVNKTVLATASTDQNGSGKTESTVGLYRSNTAITSLRVSPVSTDFISGTTATLYGILRA